MAKPDSEQNDNLTVSSKAGNTDKNAVGEAGRAARELALKIHNLSIGNDDTTVGGGLLADAAAHTRAADAGAESQKNKEKRHREDLAYLMLLQELDDLNTRIGELDDRINDFEGRYFTTGELTQFNALPENERYAAKDQALRERVENGELSHAEYEQWKEWNAELAEKKQELQDKQNDLSAKVADRSRSGQVISIKDVNHELVDQFASGVQTASAVGDVENRILSFEDLEQYKGRPEYTERADEFIAGADERTVSALYNDPSTDADIKVRIGLAYLKSELAEWEEFKGTPDYTAYLEVSISNASEPVRKALAMEADLAPEVKSLLHTSKSWSGTSVAAESGNEAKGESGLSEKFQAVADGSHTTGDIQPALSNPGIDAKRDLPSSQIS